MAGPYDYTVNIPQPPANNFLQSLLGIQQLKGLQQQSEISAQQAAIQQQQAQFAQERQPLELRQLEEQINSQKASQTSAYASAASSKAATDAKNYELTQRKALDAELLGMSSDPAKFTADNLQNLAVKFHSVDPTLLTRAGEMRKNMPDQAKNFGDNVAKNLILASVTGDTEEAIKQLDKSLEAAKNTPELQSFVPKIEQLKDNFIKYPDQTIGLAAVGQTMFAPDNGKAITDVLSEQAKTAETKAKTKVELAKLPQSGQAQLSDKQQSDVNALTAEAASIRTNVDGLTSAVDSLLKFAEQKPNEFKSGTEARLEDFASWISGNTTEAQNARSTVQLFTNKDWIAKANGLKGSLSDKEGARLDKGAPNAMSAGPAEILNWMRLAQKVELADADEKDLSAAWQANSKSLQSKAQSGFEVAGLTVKPGDTFSQTLTKLRAQYRKKGIEDIQTDAARLRRIEQAKGAAPSLVPNMYNMSGASQQQTPALVPAGGTPADVDAILKQFGVKK